MPQTHPRYPMEFRCQMVELVRAGRTPEALAHEFEPSAQTIRTWAHQPTLTRGVAKTGSRAMSGRSCADFAAITDSSARSGRS